MINYQELLKYIEKQVMDHNLHLNANERRKPELSADQYIQVLHFGHGIIHGLLSLKPYLTMNNIITESSIKHGITYQAAQEFLDSLGFDYHD